MIRAGHSINKTGMKLDPRTRILIVPMIGFAAFAIQKEEAFYIAVIYTAFLLMLSNQCKSVAKVFVFYTLTYGIDMLTGAIDNLGLTMITNMFVFITQRMGLLAMAGIFITRKVSVSELVCALEKIHLPKQLIIPFSVALRFIPTIKEEINCLKDSMKIRGIQLSIGSLIFQPVFTVEHAIVPLLMRSIKISDELAASAMIRGIDKKVKKTAIYELSLQIWDFLLMSISFLLLVTLVLI